jgi:putative uncharacterized protein 200
MTLAKQLQEKLKGSNAKNLFESNLGDARARLLQEVLITFKDNKFGNVVILAGGAGCYPKGTEFFTGSGWKNIEDFEEGDQVLQYNLEDQSAELTDLAELVKLPKDKFYTIKNRRVNFTTSENHKHLLLGERGKYYTLTTKELLEQHNKTVRGNKASLVTSFNYVGGKGLDLTDDEIRLRIAIYADGYVMKQLQNGLYRIRMSFKKERKIKRFRELINRLGIEHREYLDGEYTRFTFLHNDGDKYFKPYWYDCSVHQLEVVADEVMHWDGSISIREGRKDGLGEFGSIIKESTDFIQFVFAALGKNTTYRTDEREGYKSTGYGVGVSHSKGKGISKNERVLPENTTQILDTTNDFEDNYMYCFTVPTGFFVVRQNNQIFVSGNSGKGFVLKNLLDIQGKVFDVDRLKELALTNDYIQSVVKKEQGIDISKLDLKNPKDVSTLHSAIDKAGLDKKVKSTMFDSIVMAHPDRKPNLIFDVTLKSPDKLGKISEQVKSLGYDPLKIHVVWVVNDVEVAIAQNATRSRTVSQEILSMTHEGVANTILALLHPARNLRAIMDGKFIFAFNKAKVDSVVSGDKKTNIFGKETKPFYVKSADYVVVKEVGEVPKDLDDIESRFLKKIMDYVPETVKDGWERQLDKALAKDK